ncbi:Pre-mRNA splicing, partial [Kickxella alabastrina]
MSEEFTEEHKKLYQYAGNSNLVLPSDRSKINRRGDRGKEMESLWGKIDGNQMGSNVRREQPPKSGAGTGTGTAASKTTHVNKPKKPKKSVLGGYRDIVSATEEEEGVYKPRSRETQMVWDMLLACCRRHIGDQTPEVLVSAADEALSVLKDESSRDREKRAEVEKLFGAKVDEAEFSRFIQLASQITDYEAGSSVLVEEDDQTGDIDESGIAVEFGDDSDEGAEDDDDNEDEEHSAAEEELNRMDVDQNSQKDDDEGRVVLGDTAQSKHSAEELEARSIDAFWLQRLVAQHYADPAVVQEKTREAQALLEDSSKKVGELENALAEVFDYEHFAAVQLLVTNRDMVVWCMRLARAGAEGTEQRLAVEAQMREAGAHRLLGEAKGAEAPRKAAVAVEAEAERVAEVDLDSLVFTQGAHLMTNDRWVPPPGAVKTVMPGYEEIHVPAPEPLGAADAHNPLVSVAELPEWAREALPGVQQLNRVQSRVFATAFTTDDNMLICAPTGAGKTNCAALAMLRTIGQFRDGAGNIDAAAFKMVYVAPMKALVAEMAGAFKARLEPLGLRVAELTGDSQLTKAQIAETQLLVTTPEKWDV